MLIHCMCLLLLLPWGGAQGQSEFVVNSRQDSTQRDPQIDRDAAGNIVVVWNSINQASDSSQGDIVMKRFAGDVTGSEELVNTITVGNQEKPAMGMNANGRFVIAWTSMTDMGASYDIKARVYNRSGLPVGQEFLVNTTRPGAQTEPDVSVDSTGCFVVVWDSWDQDGGDRGVYGRLFDLDGSPRTGEFLVNTTTAYSQAKPAVKYFRDGRFVVVWESWKQDEAVPAGYGVYGKIFNADGSPASGEFQVNTFVHNNQWFADVETFSDNSFIVVWCSWDQDGDEGGIVMQRFDPAGRKIGGEMIVNQTTASYQWLPRIRRFDDDSFAVIWSSWKQDGSREGVYVRRYGPGATNPSRETQVNTYTESYQWEPDVVPVSASEVLAVWSSWGQTGKDYDIVARRMPLALP